MMTPHRLILASLLLYACSGDNSGSGGGQGCSRTDSQLGQRGEEGGCPVGQNCSSATPDGLVIRSRSLEQTPFLTAVGGVHSFTIEFPDGRPFNLPFDVEPADRPLAVESVDADGFTLRGVQAGDLFVNLREPGTGLLYDRVALTVVEPGFIDVSADCLYSALWSPAEIDVTARILQPNAETCTFLGPSPDPLVDERMTMFVEPIPYGRPAAIGSQTDWDTLRLTTFGPGKVTVTARIDAGQASTTLRVVNRLSSIFITGEPEGGVLEAGEQALICAIGQLEDQGFVRGVPFEWTVAGPVATDFSTEGCVLLSLVDNGDATITVRAPDGTTASVDIVLTGLVSNP